MGVADLVSAFNSVTAGKFNCTRATLEYSKANDTEWQILTFYGTDADGVAFVFKADRLRPGGDVIAAARETAQRKLDEAAAKAAKGNPHEGA